MTRGIPAVTFDPLSPAFLADPYPFFARYRSDAPAFFSPELNYWVISRFDDVRRAYRNDSRYSAANTLAPIQPPCTDAVAIMRDGGYRAVPALPNTDPPRHTRARRIVNSAFTQSLVAGMEPFIRALTVRFINERLSAAPVDIVQAITWELPALVLLEILGVPEADVPKVKAWAGSRAVLQFGRPDDAEQIAVAHEMVAFWRYTEDLIAGRRAVPSDDFITRLITTLGDDGQPFEPTEAATIVFGLLFAGHETTTNLLTNGLYRLLSHPTAWHEIRDDPALIPNAIEEILRIDPPATYGRRRTLTPVEIAGVPIPAGADLLLGIGSANRDETVFPDPDRFDIRRRNARLHLSFGNGRHLCLGAPLARLEARILFEELSARLPDLRLTPDQHLEYSPNLSLRAPLRLLVE